MVLNPTLWQVSEIACIEVDSGKSSMTDAAPHSRGFWVPNTLFRIELLPQPDGPTIKPTFQSKPSIGRSPLKRISDLSTSGTSKMEASCFTRALFTMGLE